MLDLFTILTKGGFVLWQKTFAPINGSPVEDLIRNVLIEERAGTDSYFKENYALKWTFANELDLVFVVAYQKILQLNYIDELLETVKRMFLETNKEVIAQGQLVDGEYSSFGPIFDKLLQQIEEKYSSQNRQRAPRKFENTKKFENSLKGSQAQNSKMICFILILKKKKAKLLLFVVGALPVINTNAVDEDEITKNIKALKLQGSPRVGGRGRKGKSNKSTPVASPSLNDDATQKKKKSQKQARVWDGQIAKGEMEALDFSNNKSNNNDDEDEDADTEAIAAQFVDESKLGQKNEKGIYEVQDVLQEDDDELDFDDDEDDALSKKVEKGTSSGLFSYFKSFTSQREMTAETLDPVIATIKEHLITQNVATDIAEHLCQSVRTSLLGKKLGSFERISTAVRNSMETALKRILTPKTSLDILRDIEQAKSEKRPYTMCFIGVNGVGKVNILCVY